MVVRGYLRGQHDNGVCWTFYICPGSSQMGRPKLFPVLTLVTSFYDWDITRPHSSSWNVGSNH